MAEPVLKIIKKYNSILPKQSNVEMNRNLKEIGEDADISEYVKQYRTIGGVRKEITSPKYELIATHTARRSMATNMYKAGVPIKEIMHLTGHTKPSQFFSYIKITETEVAENLRDHPFFTKKRSKD